MQCINLAILTIALLCGCASGRNLSSSDARRAAEAAAEKAGYPVKNYDPPTVAYSKTENKWHVSYFQLLRMSPPPFFVEVDDVTAKAKVESLQERMKSRGAFDLTGERHHIAYSELKKVPLPLPAITPFDSDSPQRDAYLAGFAQGWDVALRGDVLLGLFGAQQESNPAWRAGHQEGMRLGRELLSKKLFHKD